MQMHRKWHKSVGVSALSFLIVCTFISDVSALCFSVCLWPAFNFHLCNVSFFEQEWTCYWLFLKVLSLLGFQSFCILRILVFKANVDDLIQTPAFPNSGTREYFFGSKNTYWTFTVDLMLKWLLSVNYSVRSVSRMLGHINSTINIFLAIK